jgi:sterol desaturase/sphingolipid hydroxylase (fatty acid hydroxylase superfamily)
VECRNVDGNGDLSGPIAARVGRTGIGRLAALSQTKANAHMGLACDIAIGMGLVAFGKLKYGSGVALPMSSFLAGLLVFTFVEYAFHRWLFHGAIAFFRQGHKQHHLHPNNDDALPFFAPPMAMLACAMLLAAFVPVDVAALFVGGIAFGYACYGLGHTIIHRRRFALAWPRAWAARHHIHHNHPAKNFGVTTPLWDILLGTRYPRRGSRGAARGTERKNVV